MNTQLEQEKLNETRQILNVIMYKMAVPLYFLFWILDLIYVPQYKWEFLAIRCLIVPTALITHWWMKHTDSYEQAERAGLFLIFMCASILNTMIYIIGEGSLYSIPLQLVAIGGLSFVPWSRRYFITAILLVYVPYYAIELSFLSHSNNYNQLFVTTFFISGVLSITWVIHSYRERLRHRELLMRNDLEKEVAHRKETEQELIIARDQALAATQAKDAFLANMSHEIRTPLTAIIGFAEYSLDRTATEQERLTAFKTIVSSGNHLLNIINDILDFSKIEANSIDLESLAMDPIQLAGEVQSLIMPLANKKGLLIKLDYEFPVPASIVTDPVRVKQILINLCSNAIKFSEQGNITITLAYDTENHHMVYRVKDNGIGMTAEEMEHIFDPFKQADSSIARRYGGTGLGLSLSRKLAKLLGGTLTAYSEPSVGSEFILTINAGGNENIKYINDLDEITEHAVNTPYFNEHAMLDGDVLLAEDNENNQRLLLLYLTKMGARVTVAENGEIALKHVYSNNYDLVLMDMQMPVLSGVDAVQQLRDSGYTLPVVALTANATQEDRRQCLEAGCNDFLTKPVTREKLYQMVAKYIPPGKLINSNVLPLYSTLLDEDPEFEDIVTQFINKLPDIVFTIRHAHQTSDWEKLKEVIHNLKGMGSGFGFPPLTKLSAEIEQLYKKGEFGDILTVLDEMESIVDRINAGILNVAKNIATR